MADYELLPDAVTEDFEKDIVMWLDAQTWSNKLKRRTQHYGLEYDYDRRTTTSNAPPITGPIREIVENLKVLGFPEFTQCIVNEYTRDQGISPHIDKDIFGNIIISLSLLAPAEMVFTRSDHEKMTLVLPPRSLLRFSGDLRYKWKHEIKETKTLRLPDGTVYKKPLNYRRISLTFRTMA